MTKMWPKSVPRGGNLCIRLVPKLVYLNLSTDAVTIHVPCNIQTRGNVESVSAKVQTSQIGLVRYSFK